jgi:DNA-binding NtrC family response regulator
VVPIRTAQLRDLRSARRLDVAPGPESIALDVHGAGVLEATFEPGAPLGDWDFQMLGSAAHIGALVLEIERLRLQLVRAGLLDFGGEPIAGPAPLVGSSPAMQALRATIERVAATDFTVLIEGETGVGKELVARQIHALSPRRAPFVVITCATLVETALETTSGGTLFLDEVADLSAPAQGMLLRTIERVGFDTRLMASTNQHLADHVAQRTLRPDLFYRLNGVNVRIPALRDRRDDIIELARHFLDQHLGTRRLELSSAAIQALRDYTWPGNVRELERLIQGVVTLATSDVIDLEDLPAPVGAPYATALGSSLKQQETLRVWARRYARIMLGNCGGNKRQAASRLGISYHTLQAYLRETSTVQEAQQPVDGTASDAREWHRDLSEDTQDIYTLNDCQPVTSKDEDPS